MTQKNNEPTITYILRRLKDNGFCVDMKVDELCSVVSKCEPVELFEVLFIGCVHLESGWKRYSYECKSGNVEYLCGNKDLIHVSGNTINFSKECEINKHPSYYVCPLDICSYDIPHFHQEVYVSEKGAEYDCIFIIV